MQSVGFDGFAVIFARNVAERFRAGDVDGKGYQQDDYGDHAGLDLHVVKKEAVEAFVNDEYRGDEEQRGFHEGGKILKFAVAVGMAFVGGLVGHAHGEESDYRGQQIETGM